MARKQNFNILNDNMDPDVEITKLNGKFDLVNQKLDDMQKNFTESIADLKFQVNKQITLFDKFVTKEEYNTHLKEAEKKLEEINPVIKWVNDRKAVEKFMYGAIALIGVTNIILLIKIVFNL